MRNPFYSSFEAELKQVDNFDYFTRVKGINQIAAVNSQDAARLLLELLDTIGWRDTKRYILYKLSAFLKYNRVFFSLARLFDQTDDLQLKIWILNTFKYAKINKYDQFLVNLYQGNLSQVINNNILDVLIHIQSSLAREILEQSLADAGISLSFAKKKEGIFHIKDKLLCLPVNLQIQLVNYIGNFRIYYLGEVLELFIDSKDHYVSDCAYLNILKLGPQGDSLEDHYRLCLLHMESSDSLKDGLHQIFNENGLLQKSITLEKCLDTLFNLSKSEISNAEVLTLLMFDQEELQSYLSIYDSEEYAGLILTILAQLPFEVDYTIKETQRILKKYGDGKNCAQAAMILWDKSDLAVGEIWQQVYSIYKQSSIQGAADQKATSLFKNLRLTKHCRDLLPEFKNLSMDPSVPDIEKVELINLLVSEFYLQVDSPARARIKKFFDEYLQFLFKNKSLNKKLALRLYRAYGQIGQRTTTYYKYFEALFYKEELTIEQRNGLIWSLYQEVDSHSHKQLVKVFDHYLNSKGKSSTFKLEDSLKKMFLLAFANEKFAFADAKYLALLDMQPKEHFIECFKFIYGRPTKIAVPWLQKCGSNLGKASYLERKWLARVYSRINDDSALIFLSKLVHSEEETLQEHALYSLSQIKSNNAILIQLEVAENLIESQSHYSLVAKIFQRLRVPKGALRPFMERAEALLTRPLDSDTVDAIMSYLSRLSAKFPSSDTDVRTHVDSVMTNLVESNLREKIPSFKKLSLLVRSVLFNAEIPAAYPDIFHEQVDKSTSILQYSKAIDIYLKETLGEFINNESMLLRMQNVVLNSGIDHYVRGGGGYHSSEYSSENLLRILKLHHSFTRQEFPLGKMQSLLMSLMRGTIFREEFRVVDGLKSWGMILLLFARKWGEGDSLPLISLKGNNRDIIEIAKRLIELQDYRNPIAHRHTILEMLPVEKVKERTYKLLNDIIAAVVNLS